MALTPTEVRYGQAVLEVASLTGSRIITATVNTTYPNSHIVGGSIQVDMTVETTGVGAPTGFYGVALVEDNVDVDGNYVGTSIITKSSIYPSLLSTPVSQTLNVGDIRGGSWRLVVIAGNASGNEVSRVNQVDTGGFSSEWHADSDGNVASGGLASISISQKVVGACGQRVVASAITPTVGNWKYGQTNQIAVGIRSAGDPAAAIINPKQLKVALSTDAAGTTRPDGVYRVTPNTTGDIVATGIRVDTDFSQTIGGLDHYVQMGFNNTLGDSTTPAAEQAGIYNIAGATVTGVTTSQRSPYVFAATGHVAGTTFTNTSNVRTTTASVKISSGIQIFEDAGKVTAGVSPFQTSGYATRQDIFKRSGPTNILNAVPHLETYVFDAYGNALINTDITCNVLRTINDSSENSQALTTDGNGRIRWNYTIAANAPAWNEYVKTATSRVSNGHIATGPDSESGWGYYFSNGNAEDGATYVGPFPAYPRDAQIVGRAYGSKEPTIRDVATFGITSQPIIEAVWTGSLTAAQMDVNGVPLGAGKTGQQLGAGSLKAKITSELNPASLRVIDPSRHCLRDGAGREIDVTSDNWYQAFSTFNDTIDVIHQAAQSLNDSHTKMENSLGYNPNNNSLITIDPPTDPSSFRFFLGIADTTTQRDTFAMTTSGVDPVTGFTSDNGNFGYREQIISFEALDSSIIGILTAESVQSDPTLIKKYKFKAIRIASDAEVNPATGFNGVDTDTAPVYAVFVQPNNGGAIELLESGKMTAIGTEPTADWTFTVQMPVGYKMVKVFATARVNGSPIIGGDKVSMQVGYDFDGVGTFLGFHYK